MLCSYHFQMFVAIQFYGRIAELAGVLLHSRLFFALPSATQNNASTRLQRESSFLLRTKQFKPRWPGASGDCASSGYPLPGGFDAWSARSPLLCKARSDTADEKAISDHQLRAYPVIWKGPLRNE
jgi:hypothetical protein